MLQIGIKKPKAIIKFVRVLGHMSKDKKDRRSGLKIRVCEFFFSYFSTKVYLLTMKELKLLICEKQYIYIYIYFTFNKETQRLKALKIVF